MHATHDIRSSSTPTARGTTSGSPAMPTGRLRWLDTVRATALFVVVAGHYLLALVHLPTGGQISIDSLLDVAPWSHFLTWPLQVMPAFFAVGAFAASTRMAEHPVTTMGEWAEWMGSRVRGLIVPALPLLVLWVVLGPVLASHLGAGVVAAAGSAALVPLWFLAVYMVVQAFIPMWLRLLDDHHWGVLVAGLLVLTAVVDVLHISGVPAIGYANFVLVWSLPTLLGVVAQRGGGRPRTWLVLSATAIGAAAVLIGFFGYVLPVVGVAGSSRSNNSPPTLLLACHAVTYTGVVLAVGPRLESVLRRGSRRQRVLSLASSWSMPVYLWHMTGLVALGAAALVLQLPLVDPLLTLDPLSAAWWLLRPVWILTCLVATAALIAVTRRPSSALVARSTCRPAPDTTGVVLGIAGCASGVALIVLNGTTTIPWVPLLILGGGLLSLHPRAAGRRQ